MRAMIFFVLAVLAAGGCTSYDPIPSPPAPDAAMPTPLPDPRFKLVGAFPAYSAVDWGGGDGSITFTGSLWSPVAWKTIASSLEFEGFEFAPTPMLAPVTSTQVIEAASQRATDLPSAERSYVLTSLGFDADEWGYTGTAPAGALDDSFDVAGGEASTVADLTSQIAQAAGLGFVTTAVGFDGTMIRLASYRRHGDSHTYTTQVMTGTPATLAAAAPSLVSSGAFITAFGQVDATNYAMVITTIGGMTTPRIATTALGASGGAANTVGSLLSQGYAIVGAYFDASQTSRFVLEK